MANRATLMSQVQSLITDNTNKLNTAAKVRQILISIINSNYNTTDEAGLPAAWDEVTGKPTEFPPSAHTHVIADVTGLQTALDAKLAIADYTYTSLTTPTGASPTVTIDLANKQVISRILSLTNGSTGNATLALSNAANGSTLTIHITNNDTISRSVILPASSDHIDFSGNSKTVVIPTLKSAVFGVTYTGAKYLWTLSRES